MVTPDEISGNVEGWNFQILSTGLRRWNPSVQCIETPPAGVGQASSGRRATATASKWLP